MISLPLQGKGERVGGKTLMSVAYTAPDRLVSPDTVWNPLAPPRLPPVLRALTGDTYQPSRRVDLRTVSSPATRPTPV